MAKKPVVKKMTKTIRKAKADREVKKTLDDSAKKLGISLQALANAGVNKKKPAAPVNAFELNRKDMFPPSVVPKAKEHQIAMDDALGASAAWAGSFIAGSFNEGLQFLGYPYLAELAQRPEYRVITETIATEMTREWIEFEAVGEDKKGKKEDKSDRIKKMNDAMDKYKVRDVFRQFAINDGFFGRSHIFLDIGNANLGSKSEELVMPIGNGRDATSKAKVKKGSLNRICNIEPVWIYPTNYNAIDPTKADWYCPEVWFVMNKPIHASRLLTGIGRPVPDLLKPAYAFGGLSMSQMAKPYVDNWLETRQSVNDIISAFTVFVLVTNMANVLSGTDNDQFLKRADLFNATRDNRGVMMIDKATEDFKNVSASLATLDMLQAQAQEHMASVSRIPIVKLLGTQPAGLNATSEGEMQAFYDSIKAFQECFFRDPLTRVIDFIQLSEFGDIDQDITFKFKPLESINEKEIAETEKVKAETDNVRIDGGVISQEEVRERIASDPQSGYSSIDVSDVPDLLEEEAEGLMPKGGAANGAGGEEGDDNSDGANDELSGEIQFALDMDIKPRAYVRTRLKKLIPIAKKAGLATDARSLELKLAEYYDAYARSQKGNPQIVKNARAKASELRNT